MRRYSWLYVITWKTILNRLKTACDRAEKEDVHVGNQSTRVDVVAAVAISHMVFCNVVCRGQVRCPGMNSSPCPCPPPQTKYSNHRSCHHELYASQISIGARDLDNWGQRLVSQDRRALTYSIEYLHGMGSRRMVPSPITQSFNNGPGSSCSMHNGHKTPRAHDYIILII